MKKTIVLIIILLFSSPKVFSQNDLEVTEMFFCRKIENTEPVGIDSIFLGTIRKVFCFSKIEGALDTTMITHIWYYSSDEIAEIDLDIRSPSWRTWSSKNIMKGWTGNWRVDIYSKSGVLLKSKEFTILTPE